MARRWKGDDFAEAGNRLTDGEALLLLAEDRLTSLTSRNRFLAVPVTRGGEALVRRTRPGRRRLERSPFSLASRCCTDARGMDIHLRYALRQSRRLFLNSKFRRRIGVRFSPALELSGRCDIHLFIDFGCTRPGSRDERSWHLGERR